MKKCQSFGLYFPFLVFIILISSCRSEFENVRISNDPTKILAQADAYFDQGEYYKAQTLYEMIIPSFRGRAQAEDIYYKFAYTHYHQNNFILASHYFKNFATTYTNSDKREEADFMASYSNYQLSPTYKLDQSYSAKAIDGFQLFLNTYPESERVDQCNALIDEMRTKLERKAYEVGKLYYKLKQYSSSMSSFESVLKDYPETPKSEEIRYLIAKSSFILAENSVYLKKEERYLDAIEKSELFLKKHPNAEKESEINTFITKSNKEINKLKNNG